MSGTNCDHCGKTGPAGARSMGPRCANHANPPADHSHWVMMTGGGARYDTHGCDTCDSEWAGVWMNATRMMSQYSVYMRMFWAYESARYGKTSHKPVVPDDVKATVKAAWPSVETVTAHVCADCPAPSEHSGGGYVPTADEADAMEAYMRDRGAYDAEYDASEVCYGSYYDRKPMSRAMPVCPY